MELHHRNTSSTQFAVIQHCYCSKPVKCEILSGSTDNFFTIKPLRSLPQNLTKGDPVVLGRLQNNAISSVIGGNIAGFCDDPSKIIILTDTVCEVAINKRKFDRFPVSLYGTLKCRDNGVRAEFQVKDISCSGLKIYACEELEVGHILDMDLYANSNNRFVCSYVVRKASRYGKFEYGLNIIHDNKNCIEAMNNYIQLITNYQYTLLKGIDHK